MKIQKYKKSSTNKYKVLIDNEVYELYDDVIVEYKLLLKDTISEEELNKCIKHNDELKSYYDSIRYINKKLRSEKEIYEYLNKKNIDNDIINKTIDKLKKNHFINDEIYTKSYIKDSINLGNNGYSKIKLNLIKLGIEEELINTYLNDIDDTIWINKIDNYINKKIKSNHKSSLASFKYKMKNDLINLGYPSELVNNQINKIRFDDSEIKEKEKEKIINKLSKKYSGVELEYKIKEKLYQKGFKESNYED